MKPICQHPVSHKMSDSSSTLKDNLEVHIQKSGVVYFTCVSYSLIVGSLVWEKVSERSVQLQTTTVLCSDHHLVVHQHLEHRPVGLLLENSSLLQLLGTIRYCDSVHFGSNKLASINCGFFFVCPRVGYFITVILYTFCGL